MTLRNMLTHPSLTRNRALTQLLADVKLAEREGIGVDRMTAAMVRQGAPPPHVLELDGPYVKVSLFGGSLDTGWLTWIAAITPPSSAADVAVLLVLRQLLHTGWADISSLAPTLQRSEDETKAVIERAVRVTRGDNPVITTVEGVPEDAPPAWRVSDAARESLAECDNASGSQRPQLSKDKVAVSYAAHRGRMSSTELASIVGASHTNAGPVLKRLASVGVLRPSSPAGRGKGFHYLYDGDAS